MKITVFTSFPEFFDITANISLLGSSRKNGIWSFNVVNIRDYGITKHKSIDDTTYGGGCGMVMRPDVLGNCIDETIKGDQNKRLLITSPRGKKFNQQIATDLATNCPNLYIICNRFEGVDQRVIDYYNMEEISIGDYIMLGGETAALAIIESTVRLLDGVVGNKESIKDESFCGTFEEILEHDHYTKPPIWREIPIPEILLSGNHKEITKWRKENGKKKAINNKK